MHTLYKYFLNVTNLFFEKCDFFSKFHVQFLEWYDYCINIFEKCHEHISEMCEHLKN